MSLQGQVTVITGSTRGFGRALAETLLARGARVIISGRRAETVAAAAAQIPGDVDGIACDVREATQVYALAQHAMARFGRLDIWVNNAGIAHPPGEMLAFPPETAATICRVNCLGTLHGSQAAAYHMLQHGGGTIVNIYGRGSNLRPASPSGLYGASKAWVTSFTRTLAAEYRDLPVRIIGFSPGMMTTDLLRADEVVGERALARLRHLPRVLQALSRPPEVPARILADLLEHNQKHFLEYRYMSGLRLTKMLLQLAWLNLTHRDEAAGRPAPAVRAPFHPTPPADSKAAPPDA